MILIKGVQVVLYQRHQTGTDALGNPIYSETATTVDNVLVAPVSQQEMLESTPPELTGRRAVYQIGIPKGDTHTWLGNRVECLGRSWRVVGDVRTGIQDLVPGPWCDIYQLENIDGAES